MLLLLLVRYEICMIECIVACVEQGLGSRGGRIASASEPIRSREWKSNRERERAGQADRVSQCIVCIDFDTMQLQNKFMGIFILFAGASSPPMTVCASNAILLIDFGCVRSCKFLLRCFVSLAPTERLSSLKIVSILMVFRLKRRPNRKKKHNCPAPAHTTIHCRCIQFLFTRRSSRHIHLHTLPSSCKCGSYHFIIFLVVSGRPLFFHSGFVKWQQFALMASITDTLLWWYCSHFGAPCWPKVFAWHGTPTRRRRRRRRAVQKQYRIHVRHSPMEKVTFKSNS